MRYQLITSILLLSLTQLSVYGEPLKEISEKSNQGSPEIISEKPTSGKLTFESNRADRTVAADAEEVTVSFNFTNNTPSPVTIARMSTACACLYSKVKDEKMTYQPGEKGQIELRFELGKFSGEINKSLLLWTTDDKPNAPSSILTTYITIPQLLQIEPVTTYWQQGEAAETKTVTLTVQDQASIGIENLTSTNQNFTYDLLTISEGQKYEIKITPKDTAKKGFGIFKIKTDSKIKRYQTIAVYGCVKK